MNSEKLIELVADYDILYNYNNKSYHDTKKKESAWKEIGQILNQSEKNCKKHWTILRDSFRRNMNKRKTIGGEGALPVKSWRYEEEMSFLKPYLKDKPKISSSNGYNSNDELEQISDENASQQSEIFFFERPIKKTTTTPTLQKTIDVTKQDEIDTLFHSLAQTVKKMDPYYRALAKARVCSAVSDLELQNITRQPGATSYSSVTTQVPSPSYPYSTYSP